MKRLAFIPFLSLVLLTGCAPLPTTSQSAVTRETSQLEAVEAAKNHRSTFAQSLDFYK